MCNVNVFLVIIILATISQHAHSSLNNVRGTGNDGACEGYDGVLRIRKGDAGTGAATAFFLYTVNQLIYAEMYNLIPWVHYDQMGKIYDEREHPSTMNRFEMIDGGEISMVNSDKEGHPYPSAPILNPNKMSKSQFFQRGSGIWNHYFQPVSAFSFDDKSCQSKPYLVMDKDKLIPGVHYNAPWAVRAWDYTRLPTNNLPKDGQSTHDWMGAMRVRGTHYLKKYFKLQPWLQEQVDATNPIKPGVDAPCLAVHIRWSDKSHGRIKIPVERFLPYVQTFVKEGGQSIYLASDQATVFDIINNEWPTSITSKIRRQEGTFLSKGEGAVFDQVGHHRSNTEAIVETYAMAKCSLLLHGFSAISEAAIYLNIALHDRSVNLDDPEHPDVNAFRTMVRLEQILENP